MRKNKEALIEMKAVTIAWYEKKSLAARATSKNKLLNLLNNLFTIQAAVSLVLDKSF